MKEEKVGEMFQRETKCSPSDNLTHEADVSKPGLYKNYPDAEKISLNHDAVKPDVSFDQVLHNRKSIRKFSDEPLSKQYLSYLLWASTGRERDEKGFEFRTAPSAGACYPVETYLLVNNVEDVEQGVYHYSVQKHELEKLKTGDFRDEIISAAMGQKKCGYASVVFIWSAIFDRTKYRYGQRAYRYIYLDAGHIAENLALASTSLGLGSCQIAALYDEKVNDIIDVDGKEESMIYASVVGNPL
ncbi:MAG: SagB/ThcOx family dehydrogenase [Candidatus Thermoplasmatota archaeon]